MVSSQFVLGASILSFGSPVLAEAARTWPLEVPLLLAMSVVLTLYLAGLVKAWYEAGLGRGVVWGRAAAGILGFAALILALASPLEPLSQLLFSAHMAQHLLLILAAAPLLVLGVPLLVFLWLPPVTERRKVVRWWRTPNPLRRLWRLLTHPLVSTSLFVALLWSWHLPALYEGALARTALHSFEHVTLLVGAGLFWWTVLQPMGRRRLSSFSAPLVLFLVAVQGGILGAMVTLAAEPWYGHYVRVAQALGSSALADQQLAGLLMWIPPGAVFLLIACWLLYRALGAGESERAASWQPGASASRPDDGTSRTTDGASRTADGTGPTGRRVAASAISTVLATGLSAWGEAQVLEPVGPAAREVSSLFWLMLVLASIVCLVVFLLLLVAVFGPRRQPVTGPPLGNGAFVVLGGIVVPLLILIPLMFYSLGVTAAIARPAEDALTIEIVGHQWWWEVRYPESGVVDANEIHIPVGAPVRLKLTSEDVIHSFWAPGLQGKMDLIPGSETTLWIEADEVGIYRAKCAEFCGAQHANMRLLVVSEPEESFGEWLADHQRTPPPPRDDLARRGQEVFLASPCVSCHTIEGTAANGEVGPNLTHLGSRMTLGAGTVANNRGNLGGWIVNSQAIKPGNRMPPMLLESQDLHALLAYLESLE